MHEQVFPDFAVKQAMCEVDIDREDDIIVSSIQSDLTTKCLVIILKGAMCSCIFHKRKYINERDISYALQTTTYPVSPVHSGDVGYLLDTRQLGIMCISHVDLVRDMFTRAGVESSEIKVSSDMLLILQDAVERLIRGVFAVFKTYGAGKKNFGYRVFDSFMSDIVGDPQLADSNFVRMGGASRDPGV